MSKHRLSPRSSAICTNTILRTPQHTECALKSGDPLILSISALSRSLNRGSLRYRVVGGEGYKFSGLRCMGRRDVFGGLDHNSIRTHYYHVLIHHNPAKRHTSGHDSLISTSASGPATFPFTSPPGSSPSASANSACAAFRIDAILSRMTLTDSGSSRSGA